MRSFPLSVLVSLSFFWTVTFAWQFTSQHRTAVVTGANGYLGKSIVHELLDNCRGVDRILCLVRASRVSSEEHYWNDISTTGSKISVLSYDMLDGGNSLGEALQLANEPCCVYHVASNFGPSENHTESALENVKGTEDLIQALAKDSNPHKLVLTSSMAAVRGSGQIPTNQKFYTVEDWNTLSELGANWGSSYQWSKAESERRAIALAQQVNLPIVTLCPSFLFGPTKSLDSTNSFSLQLVGQWVRGESPVQSRLFADVRDCALAHVAAGCSEAANGKRYIVSLEQRVASQEIATWLQQVCTESGRSDPHKIQFDAEFSGGAIPIGEKEVEAEQRLEQELGVKLRPVKDTIVGIAKTLLTV